MADDMAESLPVKKSGAGTVTGLSSGLAESSSTYGPTHSSGELGWETLLGIQPRNWARSLARTPSLVYERAFRTRSLSEAVEEKEEESGGGELRKTLGWFDLICIGIGCVLGSGVFTSTPFVANVLAGPAVIPAYAISSISAIFSGLCYAEYAVDFPIAGGAYGFVVQTFGEYIGWMEVCNLLFGYMVSAAGVARSATGYWAALVGHPLEQFVFEAGGYQLDPLAACTVAALTLLVIFGAKEGSNFNMVMTVFHLLVVVFIIVAGFTRANPTYVADFTPFGVKGLFSGAAYVYFAYTGFDVVATSAEECKNPRRDLPIGIVGCILVVTVLYILMAAVLVLMVPYTLIQGDDGGYAAAFDFVGMHWAKFLVAAGALVGMITSCWAGLFGQARILCVVARDHMLPPVFARISPRLGTPAIAAATLGSITAVIALITAFEELFVMTSTLALITFWLTAHGCLFRRYYVRGKSAAWPIIVFIGIHTFFSIGFAWWYQDRESWQGLVGFGVPVLLLTAALQRFFTVRYVPAHFSMAFGPWIPSLTAFFNVFLMASLKGADVEGYKNIGWFMLATTILYAVYSVHTAANKKQARMPHFEDAPLFRGTASDAEYRPLGTASKYGRVVTYSAEEDEAAAAAAATGRVDRPGLMPGVKLT